MERPYRDPIAIQVIHLDHADAEHLVPVLADLLSKQGRVVGTSKKGLGEWLLKLIPDCGIISNS